LLDLEINVVDGSLVWEVLDQPDAFEKRHCGTSSLASALTLFSQVQNERMGWHDRDTGGAENDWDSPP